MTASEPGENVVGLVAAGYDAVAERYARLEEREWPRMRRLRDVLRRLPDGARVLDLGCGSGLPAAAESASRHAVIGVDVSGRQVALARENVPEGEFLHADALGVAFPPESFDAVVSFYALDHVPRDRHGELLRRVHGWLRPGGYLLVSVEDGDEPGVVGPWLGAPMFFSHFDAETTARLARAAGLAIERAEVEPQLEAGREIRYLWLLARKPEPLREGAGRRAAGEGRSCASR